LAKIAPLLANAPKELAKCKLHFLPSIKVLVCEICEVVLTRDSVDPHLATSSFSQPWKGFPAHRQVHDQRRLPEAARKEMNDLGVLARAPEVLVDLFDRPDLGWSIIEGRVPPVPYIVNVQDGYQCTACGMAWAKNASSKKKALAHVNKADCPWRGGENGRKRALVEARVQKLTRSTQLGHTFVSVRESLRRVTVDDGDEDAISKLIRQIPFSRASARGAQTSKRPDPEDDIDIYSMIHIDLTWHLYMKEDKLDFRAIHSNFELMKTCPVVRTLTTWGVSYLRLGQKIVAAQDIMVRAALQASKK
jgi:hypothetical protein